MVLLPLYWAPQSQFIRRLKEKEEKEDERRRKGTLQPNGLSDALWKQEGGPAPNARLPPPGLVYWRAASAEKRKKKRKGGERNCVTASPAPFLAKGTKNRSSAFFVIWGLVCLLPSPLSRDPRKVPFWAFFFRSERIHRDAKEKTREKVSDFGGKETAVTVEFRERKNMYKRNTKWKKKGARQKSDSVK